jgi:UDP-N-acetyl-D-mannosaminuronate dehydrogenase|tara:strand:- start:915 stop:1697 length:783 start_codon:yes stop_codon:yes gene_type:complete
MKKDIVAGLGEIGMPLLKLISKKENAIGYDLDKKLMNQTKFKKFQDLQTRFLHIAIPVTKSFNSNVIKLYEQFMPECIVIHSTISPGTTEQLQKKLKIPLIFSATRGVHKRMLKDLQRYTKFFAISKSASKKEWAAIEYRKTMMNCGIKTQRMSKPETLELAKILCDTSYLGWLINYAQLTNTIAIQHNVDYDEMWKFSDEIHELLGNRPKMFPGFIGGHCVIPNLDLMQNQTLNLIKTINQKYSKKVKNSKTIHKNHTK